MFIIQWNIKLVYNLYKLWEGVGVCSYLLINFWFRRLQANKAAIQAIVMNRIGDWGFSIALFIIFWLFGNIDYYTVLSLASIVNPEIITLIMLAFLLAAMGKSAQIGLHTWLPNAMEGKLLIFIFSSYLLWPLSNENLILSTLPVLTNYQKEAITGLLLSDGHLRNPNNLIRPTGNKRLEFTFKESTIDVIRWFKFNVLGSISTLSLPTPWPKDNPKQYWFSTRNHPYFTEIYDIWYQYDNHLQKFIKIVPKSIDVLFTEVSLAFFIMGDGYWDKDAKTVILCTESFKELEVELLIKILKNKYGLLATMKKRGLNYRLRFSGTKNNIEHLRNLVIPNMHPQMLYKLNM